MRSRSPRRPATVASGALDGGASRRDEESVLSFLVTVEGGEGSG